MLLLAAVASAHQPPHHTSHYREYREYTESKVPHSAIISPSIAPIPAGARELRGEGHGEQADHRYEEGGGAVPAD